MFDISILKQLKEKEDKMSFPTGKYIYEENPHTEYINKKIFKESKSGASLITSGLFQGIVSNYANYIGKPDLQIGLCELDNSIIDLLTFNYCTFGISINNASGVPSFCIQYLPTKQHVIMDGENCIITQFKNMENSIERYYILVQKFLVGGIENRLYSSVSIDTVFGTEVPLTSIKETENMEPFQSIGMPIDTMYFTYINENLQENPSLLDIVRPMILSIEKKMAEREAQYLKHTEPFILMKNINKGPALSKKIMGGGNIDIKEFGSVIFGEDGASIEYISYKNELIKESLQEQEQQIYTVAGVTGLSAEALGLKPASQTSGASRVLMNGPGIRRVQMMREKLEKTFVKIMKNLGFKDENTSVIWSDIVTKSDNELVNELTTALNSGIISRKRAIMLYLGMSEEEAEKEQENIIS